MKQSDKKFWAGGFLYNPEMKSVLLHKRDGNTNQSPNKWAFFGGTGEESETPEEAFIREIKEELNIDVFEKEIQPLCDYFNKEQGTYRYAFFVQSDLEKSEMKLGEGEDFDWIPLDEVFSYDLTEKTERDLKTFLEMKNKPRIGVGAMIMKNGKVLLGKRKGSHGAGEYAFPGGHLEYMESFEDCARRETLEECGVEIENVNFQFLANVKKYSPKHYVHIGLVANWKSGEPEVLEPEQCDNWGWYSLDKLPSPLFEFCAMSIDSYRNGKIYYDL